MSDATFVTSSWISPGTGAEDERVWGGGVEGGESGKMSARGWRRGGEFCTGGDGQDIGDWGGFLVLKRSLSREEGCGEKGLEEKWY